MVRLDNKYSNLWIFAFVHVYNIHGTYTLYNTYIYIDVDMHVNLCTMTDILLYVNKISTRKVM